MGNAPIVLGSTYRKELRLRLKYEAEKREAEEQKLEKPWRDFEENGSWKKEYRDQLVESIKRHKVYESQTSVKILFLGPIRAGKSSFINSVASIDKNRIASPMLSGETAKSMSTKLQLYKPKNNLLNEFRLLDTMGLEESQDEGFNVQDVIHLIEGNVKANYKFNTRTPIDTTDSSFYKKEPTPADKAPCVVIVMDSMVIATDSITTEAKEKIHELQKHIRDKDVPVVMLLTKIDHICEEIESETSFVYTSRIMENIVRKAIELFGVTKKDIFPIRNYSGEQHLNVQMDILILLALRRMLDIANDRLETIADQEECD